MTTSNKQRIFEKKLECEVTEELLAISEINPRYKELVEASRVRVSSELGHTEIILTVPLMIRSGIPDAIFCQDTRALIKQNAYYMLQNLSRKCNEMGRQVDPFPPTEKEPDGLSLTIPGEGPTNSQYFIITPHQSAPENVIIMHPRDYALLTGNASAWQFGCKAPAIIERRL
jgi:hypothetical protein